MPDFDVQPNVSNHFAWLRTALGLDRTLMAAVRTAVSLIGFGFTVAQFFQKLQGSIPAHLRTYGTELPRNLGLVLIAAGVLSLATFTLQYHSALRYLRSEPFAAIAPADGKAMRRPTYLVAYAVLLIGVVAFGSILLRF